MEGDVIMEGGLEKGWGSVSLDLKGRVGAANLR
jgi:hypothetical protein